MVLSRDVLLDYTDLKIDRLQKKLNADKRIGIVEPGSEAPSRD